MIYRKRGSVARWENGTLVRVTESGVAIDGGELFECHPEPGDAPYIDEARVGAAVRAIESAVAASGVTIERLIVSDGAAEHECIAAEGQPPVRWSDRTERVHLSLVHAHTRALLDLGSFATEDIERVAGVLARAEEVEREAPPRLRLAPNVTAALLPSLVGITPPNVRLVQTAVGVDGEGSPIVEATGPWPNVYRPSYRVRPVRMPLQLRLECDVTAIDRDRPVAVALLGPVSLTAGGLFLQVLVDAGRSAFPSTVRVARIDAVSADRTWYPYGGGSFGAEMML
jgi:hypothetical protein